MLLVRVLLGMPGVIKYLSTNKIKEEYVKKLEGTQPLKRFLMVRLLQIQKQSFRNIAIAVFPFPGHYVKE